MKQVAGQAPAGARPRSALSGTPVAPQSVDCIRVHELHDSHIAIGSEAREIGALCVLFAQSAQHGV